MQINAASLLAAQQARPQQPTPQRAQPKPSGDDLFEPLFGKAEEPKAALSSAPAQSAAPVPYTRPGSQIDIRI